MTDETATGVFFAVYGVILLIALIPSILTIIGLWKTMKKTGEPGWKGIVPLYNAYILCQKTGVYEYWPFIVLGLGVLSVIPVLGALISFAGSLYFAVLFNVSLAKSFGKDTGFAVGLILLPPIFYLILGGKNSNYVGANPMDDPVMKFVNEKFLNKNSSNSSQQSNPVNTEPTQQAASFNDQQQTEVLNTEPQQTEVLANDSQEPTPEVNPLSACPNCGTAINPDTVFCPSCGRTVK